MNNPVITIVINLVLVVVLIGLLIGAAQIEVLNGGSLVFGGISIGTGNDSFLISDESYEKGSSGSVAASEITSLDIAWTAGAVNIVPADTVTIRFSEESKRELEEEQLMRWRVKDGVLSIRFGTKGGPFRQDPEKTLTIEIPASDWEAENVEIQTVSANLSIDTIVTTDFNCDSVSGNCTAEEIKGNVINFNSVSGMVRIQKADCKRMSIDSVSGTITIENAAVTDQLAVSTVSGELSFSGGAKELSADTTSGDIELIISEAGDSIEIDSTSGDATIILPEEVSGFDAEFDTMSGELSCDFSTNRKDGRFTYGDQSLEIEVDTTSGDLRIEKT